MNVGTPERATAFVALRCLRHPWSITAVLVLVANDHLLKGNAPAWFTGKLSDVAGLFFFPYLVALVLGIALPRMAGRRAFWIVGVWFAAVNLLPPVTRVTEIAGDAISPVGFRSWPDPTDLVALVALFPSYRLWRHCESERRPRHRNRELGAVVLAGVASLATSPSAPPVIESLTTVNGNVYAQVLDGYEEHSVFVSESGLSDWTQVEGPPSAVVTALQAVRTSSEGIQCDDDGIHCFRQRTHLKYERSTNGGLTFVGVETEETPTAFSTERREPFIEVQAAGCGDGACYRLIDDPLGASLVQSSHDHGETWTEHSGDRPGDTMEWVSDARCAVSEPSRCFRRVSSNEISYDESADGGITWTFLGRREDGIPDPWRGYSRFNQVPSAVCLDEPGLCFRVFIPDGNGPARPTLQESRDGGRTWTTWRHPSPRLRLHPRLNDLVPDHLAVVGSPNTLVVGFGIEGTMVRLPDGSWDPVTVGPVEAASLPVMTEPFRSPLVSYTWGATVTMLVAGLGALSMAIGNRLPFRRLAPPLVAIATGVAFFEVVAVTTDDRPYGIVSTLFDSGWTLDLAAFVAVPLTVVLLLHRWASNAFGQRPAIHASVLAVGVGVGVQVLTSLPFAFRLLAELQ